MTAAERVDAICRWKVAALREQLIAAMIAHGEAMRESERERAFRIIQKHFGKATMRSLECTSEIMNAE